MDKALWIFRLMRVFALSAIYFLVVVIGAVIVGIIRSLVFRMLFPPPNIGSEQYLEKYLIPASLPFFLAVRLIILISYLTVRKKLVAAMSNPANTVPGLLIWILLVMVSSMQLPIGNYIFTIPAPAIALFTLY